MIRNFILSIRPQIIIAIMSVTSFGLLAFLTRFPASFFWYGVLLISFFVFVFWLYQGIRYQSRYRAMLDDAPVSLGYDPIDELYQEKILLLKEQLQDQEQEYREREQEQLDYFTLWLHQIKTPIAAMSLLHQQLPHTGEKKQLEQELIRVEDYTHMALNYLKLEGNNQELDLTEVDLDAVIKKVIKKYASLFIYNAIQLDYKPTHLTVVSDSKWLEVLIEQVLSNSLKYTPKGSIRIYTENNQLIIEDNGSGIRSEDLPKIFEKGYTGMSGRLHEKSTGLGLFLSRMICKRLGHAMTIESEVNVFTRVTLDLSRERVVLFD